MNLASLVSRHADTQPDKPAIETGAEVLSYGTLDLLVRRIVTRLRAAGVDTGDVVALFLRDAPLHVAAMLAAAWRGVTVLPLDWRWTPSEIARITASLRPKLVLVEAAGRLPEALARLTLAGIENERPDPSSPVAVSDRPLFHVLTSGTTGDPKAMVLTHAQMDGRSVAHWLPLHATDRVAPVLPLAYAAGQNWHLATLCAGATLVMLPIIVDRAELAEQVNTRAVDVLMLTPTATRDLLAMAAGSEQVLMPKLRALVVGTAGLSADERAAVRARVTPWLVAYYGATGAGAVAVIRDEAAQDASAFVGRLLPGVDVEIVDEDHRPLGADAIGWVRLRGAGMTQRFVPAEAASGNESIRDGWYYPGDLGSRDASGALHLYGRTADLIKRGGMMIHAVEVEQVLQRHPAVAEAAVVGIPSPSLGEEVAAFVVLREPVSPSALTRYCRQHLATHKVPQRLIVIDQLPRNANGKVLKSALSSEL